MRKLTLILTALLAVPALYAQDRSGWLDNYEIPANSADRVEAAVPESYGPTDAIRYSTATESHKIVVHTYFYRDRVIRNFTLLFDRDRRCALWVAFAAAGKGDFEANGVGRKDAWGFDPALPREWQPNIRSAYAGGKYDRGHQVASNDRQTELNENRQTFYFSNMSPQFGALNRGQWSRLESKVQACAKKTADGDTLYVVTGPFFSDSCAVAYDNDSTLCPVPDGFYKCLMRCSFDSTGRVGSAVGTAFVFETNSTNAPPDTTTIDAVEQRTGFDFFHLVPEPFQSEAENMSYRFW